MASRTLAKPGRSTGKATGKASGKDQGKGDKQAASILEIVPGKFNENDWLSLLDNDETEDYIADIFESIWTETSKQIEQLYIRRQLLPFTLMMTENALSSVIQVNGNIRAWYGEDFHRLDCSGPSWNEMNQHQWMAISGQRIQVNKNPPFRSWTSFCLRTHLMHDGQLGRRRSSGLS